MKGEKRMAKYRFHVSYISIGTVEVEAANLDGARKKAFASDISNIMGISPVQETIEVSASYVWLDGKWVDTDLTNEEYGPEDFDDETDEDDDEEEEEEEEDE